MFKNLFSRGETRLLTNENCKLYADLASAKNEIAKLKQDVASERALSDKRLKAFQDVQQDYVAAKKALRAQTEADLLLNALQALKIVPTGDKEPDYFAEHSRLTEQLRALQNANTHNLTGLAGYGRDLQAAQGGLGLGLGSLLGGRA